MLCMCVQTVEEHHGDLDMRDGLSLMPVILHPQSVGTVRLRSSDPHDAPLIDPHFLTADADVKAAVSGNLKNLFFCFRNLPKILALCKLVSIFFLHYWLEIRNVWHTSSLDFKLFLALIVDNYDIIILFHFCTIQYFDFCFQMKSTLLKAELPLPVCVY